MLITSETSNEIYSGIFDRNSSVIIGFVVAIFVLATILRCHKSNSGKAIYDKKHVCLFCAVSTGRIAKHLQGHHKSKEEIKLLLKLNNSNNNNNNNNNKSSKREQADCKTILDNFQACGNFL